MLDADAPVTDASGHRARLRARLFADAEGLHDHELIEYLLAVALPLMYRAFASGSGYAELARRFPADHVPEGRRYDWQSVRFGAVRWRRCATLIFSPEGLYLAFMPAMPVLGRLHVNHHPAVLIPWAELKSATPTTLYWQRAVAITIGKPTVAVLALYQPFFSLIEPYTSVRVAN